MKTKLTILALILSLGIWAQSPTPAPANPTTPDKATCCESGKCCSGMACDRKDTKEAKAGCCAGMHDGQAMKQDGAACCGGKNKDGKMACMRKEGDKASSCCAGGKCCGDKADKTAKACGPECCGHDKAAAGAAK